MWSALIASKTRPYRDPADYLPNVSILSIVRIPNMLNPLVTVLRGYLYEKKYRLFEGDRTGTIQSFKPQI